jgi:hypothetical protein
MPAGRREVWNLRTHRCFRALKYAFARGCERSPREAFYAIRYVLENWAVHAAREKQPSPRGTDPCCSAWTDECGPPLVAKAQWWLLCIGVPRAARTLEIPKFA